MPASGCGVEKASARDEKALLDSRARRVSRSLPMLPSRLTWHVL